MKTKNKIKVENGEVVQYKNTEPFVVKGKNHENGGVNIPDEDAAIFSKRVFFENESMADRKLNRMNKENEAAKTLFKLQKIAAENPFNLAAKTSVDRTIKALAMLKSTNLLDDAKDIALMEYAKNSIDADKDNDDDTNVSKDTDSDMKTFAAGGLNRKKFKDPGLFDGGEPKNLLFDRKGIANIASTYTEPQGASPNLITTETLPTITPKGVYRNTSISKLPTINKGVDYQRKVDIPSVTGVEDTNDAVDMGKLGTYMKALSPALFSIIDAITTKPHVNTFNEVGDASLRTLDEAARNLNISNQIERQNLERDAAGARLANSKNTRSLSVLRSLNLATDLATDKAKQELNKNIATTNTNLLSTRANIELNASNAKAQGAEIAQNANEENLSQILINLNNAGQAAGSGFEHRALMDSRNAYNEQFLSVLNTISPNVEVYRDENGMLKFKQKVV